MAVSNKYTKQTPVSTASTAAVVAERVYVADADTAYAAPTARLNGGDPAGFTDLGVISDSRVAMTVNKTLNYIQTGIENVRRGSYITEKTATLEFTLEQYDITTLEVVFDLTKDAVGAIGHRLSLGSEGVVEKALVFVGTNVTDNTEYHHYVKKATLLANIEQADDKRVIRCTAECYPFVFTGAEDEGFIELFELTAA